MVVCDKLREDCRSFSCCGCGGVFDCNSGRGRLPKWCGTCRRVAGSNSEKGRIRRSHQESPSKKCQQCGREWTPKKQTTRFCSPRCRSLACGDRVVLPCACCGKAFECCSASAKARKYCSRGCSRKHRGVQERTCVECGKSFKRSPHSRDKAKYCSRACYFAARNAGRQAWNRSDAQNENIWHIGGRWFRAPSRVPTREMLTNMGKFLAKIKNLYAKASLRIPECETCGSPCKRSEARFCSPKCCGQNSVLVECSKCGEATRRRGVGKVAMCLACKKDSARAVRKNIRKETGTNRKRCRKGGGYFNPAVKRKRVFERDRYRCWICHVRCNEILNDPREATLDHVKPLAKGGDHDWGNLRCACRRCNTIKSDSWEGRQCVLPFD